jgi:hypothetical protein
VWAYIQPQTSCITGVSGSTAQLPATGGLGNFSVAASATCTWSVTSTAPWISINSGAAGVGNQVVTYTMAANPGPVRGKTTPALTVTEVVSGAVHTFAVTQDGGCQITLINPASQTVTASGASNLITVATTTDPGCVVAATSNDPTIISLVGGAQITLRFTLWPRISYLATSNPPQRYRVHRHPGTDHRRSNPDPEPGRYLPSHHSLAARQGVCRLRLLASDLGVDTRSRRVLV